MKEHPLTKRVGIYAGTFDPVHEGHLAFAEEALERCGLDKIFFLVEPRPRRKQGVRALEHRLRMTQAAIKNQPRFGSIAIDQGQFSVQETLPLLHARFKGAELHMLMGDDVLAHLAEWPHVEQLINKTRFVIAVRSGQEEMLKSYITHIEKIKGLSFHYITIEPSLSSISSSKIRQSLKRGKETEGLPTEVLPYIREHGLYAPGEEAASAG